MIASLLRYFRTLHNLKQKTVADLLGMSQANYSDLENGKTKLSTIAAEKLAEQYGVSINQFYADKGVEQSGSPNELQASNPLNNHEVKEYRPLYNIDLSERPKQFSKEEIVELTLQLKNLAEKSSRLLNWLSVNYSTDQP